MSIRNEQKAVLQDEINLMIELEKAASGYQPSTSLGETIRQGWYNTFVHFRESNDAAIGGSQEGYDSSLDEEEAQLQAFLKSVIPGSADADSWNLAFTQDLEIIKGLRGK